MSDVKQLKVEEYDIVSFVMKIQQGIRDGYEVNDSSDDAPIQIGGAFHLIMREKEKTVEQDVLEALIGNTELHETSITIIPVTNAYIEETQLPEPEPTLDESLPKEEQVAPKQPTKRGRK